MHLIIPYAASHALTGPEVWAGWQLPHLQALLSLLQRQQVLQDLGPAALHLPHERLQAKALGCVAPSATRPGQHRTPGLDDALPLASWHGPGGDGRPRAFAFER